MKQTWPERLLGWYDQHKRALPWRERPTAYQTWVSEVMLQQTRVEAVKEYYRRFLARFPAVEDLAAATEEEVLQQWQGLGYYSRARHLWQGAKETVARYGGLVPAEEAALRTLPGIGDYTAGAILSIAYNQAVPAVDGNVLRVFSRLYALTADIQSQTARRQVTALVREVMPPARAGDFNQALMDLGSAVCIPEGPRCTLCPLQADCQALASGRQQVLPVRKAKAPPKAVRVVVGLLRGPDGFWLEQRPRRGLLAGMWQFVAAEAPAGAEAAVVLEAKGLVRRTQVEPAPLLRLAHLFSHRRWELEVYRCRGEALSPLPGWRCLELDEFGQVLWAGPHGKIADWLRRGEAEDGRLPSLYNVENRI